ncbi:hypothetical protein FACS189499_05550 [Clostridia bacterium]|nr:hypothetical protein FACS189499_05550 [Clostridia bacterium]
MADTTQIKEITAKLEQGVKDLFESDKYAKYLQTMSRFHAYSTRNTILIHLQNPEAKRVGGFRFWQKEFNRHVKKGEHGIKIFAPVANKSKDIEVEKLDPVTKLPVLDENGQPVIERLSPVSNLQIRFKLVTVFSEEQTEGDALPELAETLTGDVERYELFMDALRAVSPLPIIIKEMPSDMDSTCYFGDRIAIRMGMSEVQTVSAVIHELTHAVLHDRDSLAEGEQLPDTRTSEVQAESVSFVTNSHFLIDTSANAWGYIAEWSRGKELKELNASLDIIRKTSAKLIDAIDKQYHALAKERGIDLSVVTDAANEVSAEQNYNMIDGIINNEPPKNEKTNELSKTEMTNELSKTKTQNTPDILAAYGKNAKAHDSRHIGETISAAFEKQLSAPTEWADFTAAAFLNRIAEAEKHNVPVRELRESERQYERELQKESEKRLVKEKREIFDDRVDKIAKAIETGGNISVAYDEGEYDGKNPVLDLFRLYGVALPLKTQGWVNKRLAEIKGDSYSFYTSNGGKASSAFMDALHRLIKEVKLTPIEQKRYEKNKTTEEQKQEIVADKFVEKNEKMVVKKTSEQELYKKFAEMFPDFMSQKYRYMKLETSGFEPLSLEWIFGDRISVMQTYTMNGDLMYDPMIEFSVNSTEKTMNAVTYENSGLGLYQYHDEDGVGRSVDGNGNQREVRDLSKKLNDFAKQWFRNLEEQRHIPVRATLWNSGGIDEMDVIITFDKDGKAVIDTPEVKTEKQNEIDVSLPDPSVTIAEMNTFGYTAELLPLSQAKALELFEIGNPVYLLYPDNTEAMALDTDEIKVHDGFCGVEVEDWKRIQATEKFVITENSRESDWLHSSEPMFGIYQIKDDIEGVRNFRFVNLRELEAHGLSVNRGNYELVYSAPLTQIFFSGTQTDTAKTLETLYERFNGTQPTDFAARSVSVSDVIVLNYGNEISAHYVDSAGFRELPSFTGNERVQITLSKSDLAKAINDKSKPTFNKRKPSLHDRMGAAQTLLGELEEAKQLVPRNAKQNEREV